MMSLLLAYTFDTGNGTRHDLVEDVVRTLQRLLGDDTGLLQQICNLEERRACVVVYGEDLKCCLNLQVSISAPASLPVGPK